MNKENKKWRISLHWHQLAISYMVVGMTLSITLSGASAQESTNDSAGGRGQHSQRWERGERALSAIGDRLPATARAYGLSVSLLREMFATDPTLAVDGQW